MTSIDDHASNFFLKRPPPKVTRNVTSNHESMKLVQSDVAAYKSKLELLYRTARACVSTYLEKERWIILLVDHFKLVDRYLTPEDIEFIYVEKPGNWTFEYFVSGLWDVAIRKYVDRLVSGGLKIVQKKTMEQKLKEDQEKALDSAETIMGGGAKEVNAFKKLLSIMFESPMCVAYINEVPLTRWNETKAIERIFYTYEKVLKRLFDLYAKELDPHFEDELASPIQSTGKALPYIIYQKFIKFCTDFRFYPDRIDGFSLQLIFSSFDDRKDPTKFCLNLKNFWDSVLRFSLIFFGRGKYEIRNQPPEVKLLAYFDEIRPYYKEIFGHPLDEDLQDLSKIKCPNVTSIEPAQATSAGNVLITIYGEGFDPRLGDVVLRFSEVEDRVEICAEDLIVENQNKKEDTFPNHSFKPTMASHVASQNSSQGKSDAKSPLIIPCQYISWGEVRCRIPPIHETSLQLKTYVKASRDPRNRDLFHVHVSNKVSILIQVSNDASAYSPLGPEPPIFTYIDVMDPFTIDPAIVKSLHKIFVGYCKLEEPRNTQYLTVSKWKMLKYEMSLVKQLMLPKFQDILRSIPRQELVKRMRAYTSSDELLKKNENGTLEQLVEEDENPDATEFFIFSQQRMLRQLICFEEFIRLLVYFALFTVEDLHPIDFLLELVSNYNRVLPKSSTTSNVLPLEVISKIEKELSLIQIRSRKMFDIYSGAVHVGTIKDEPGYIQRIGETIITAHPHKLWNYVHYDIHTQNSIMKIMEFSSSFDHFIHRILKEGYDIAAMNEDCDSRKLLGRCWSILNPITNEKIGTFWDYPGTISHLNWIPFPRQIDRPFTLMVYEESDFHALYRIFTRSKGITELRELLIRSEYRIKTSLYQF